MGTGHFVKIGLGSSVAPLEHAPRRARWRAAAPERNNECREMFLKTRGWLSDRATEDADT